MRQKSWRHHFIPEFYLKGFTNDENQFAIYSVKNGKFKKDGKFFSTESHFFKKHDNTVFDHIRGATDLLELQYAELDSKIAPVFKKFKNDEGDNCYGITPDDRLLLQYFVSILFWRLPSNNDVVKQMTEHDIFEFLGLDVVRDNTFPAPKHFQLNNPIRQHKDYHKILRLWIPQITFSTMFGNQSSTTIITFPPSKLPAICGDNPLILRNPHKLDLYNDDFILPLNRDIIFLRTKKKKQPIHTKIKIYIDMLALMQANELVCSTDLKYIGMLKDVFEKDFKNIDNLREYIFNHLCES